MLDKGTVIIMLFQNIKNNFFAIPLLFSFFFSSTILSRIEYNVTLENVTMINENVMEFEINIRSAKKGFNLTSYQCSLLLTDNIANGGHLTFYYVEGTSQITNLPNYADEIFYINDEYNLIFASWVGSDVISEDRLIIGRFRLQNTVHFSKIIPKFKWNFKGSIPTILTGESFKDITIPGNFYYSYNQEFDRMLIKSSAHINIPSEFKLLQNYPNPFNPTTKIMFDLPEDSHVNLAVYNLLGQEIKIVINDVIDAGTHSVNFSSEGLTSGMYFCKLKVDNKFVEIIKMILLR